MMRVQSKPENNGCRIAHAAIFFYSDTCARKIGVSGCLMDDEKLRFNGN